MPADWVVEKLVVGRGPCRCHRRRWRRGYKLRCRHGRRSWRQGQWHRRSRWRRLGSVNVLVVRLVSAPAARCRLSNRRNATCSRAGQRRRDRGWWWRLLFVRVGSLFYGGQQTVLMTFFDTRWRRRRRWCRDSRRRQSQNVVRVPAATAAAGGHCCSRAGTTRRPAVWQRWDLGWSWQRPGAGHWPWPRGSIAACPGEALPRPWIVQQLLRHLSQVVGVVLIVRNSLVILKKKKLFLSYKCCSVVSGTRVAPVCLMTFWHWQYASEEPE